MGKFKIEPTSNGQFKFNLKADNHQVILSSEHYSTKSACQKGIVSIQKNCVEDARYDRLKSKNDKFYFNLKAGNGEIIGTSEMYESSASMENGIASVKKNGTTNTIED